MGQVTWTDRALADAERIHAYYRQYSLGFADSLIESWFDRTELLTDFPEMGRIVPEYQLVHIRELVDSRARIIYEIDSGIGAIGILAVFLAPQNVSSIEDLYQ